MGCRLHPLSFSLCFGLRVATGQYVCGGVVGVVLPCAPKMKGKRTAILALSLIHSFLPLSSFLLC